jgi:hypothetical protein
MMDAVLKSLYHISPTNSFPVSFKTTAVGEICQSNLAPMLKR